MRKLRLTLDTLSVETFAPPAAPPAPTRGTVRGHAKYTHDCATVIDCDTLYLSCNWLECTGG